MRANVREKVCVRKKERERECVRECEVKVVGLFGSAGDLNEQKQIGASSHKA